MTFILLLLCVVLLIAASAQQYALQYFRRRTREEVSNADYWQNCYNKLWDNYVHTANQLYSPRHRKLEKAYRAQLKRAYKKQYRGVFAKPYQLGANNRGYFLHSFKEAQNQRHWLETIKDGSLSCYKPQLGEKACRLDNHKKYLGVAKGFTYFMPTLP